MNCSVCGNSLGLWAKLTAHGGAPVCKACREDGDNRIQVLLRAVRGSESFKLQIAEGWIRQFDDVQHKFGIPGPEIGPLKLSFFDSIFRLVESEDVMAEADLRFLLAVSQKYGLSQSTSPELRDTIIRIGMKEIIQSWERGEVPRKDCTGLVLQKSEVCHWEEGAGLRVQRNQREYVGGYSSVSVPVPLVRGVRFRVGGFKGHPIDHTVLEDGGTGVLHITNQRVCFTGQQRSVAIPFKKMISVSGFENGFIVQTSNEKKPGIFVVRHPELTAHLLNLAAASPDEEIQPSKGRKKLAPPA
jgi:hypothetical protein